MQYTFKEKTEKKYTVGDAVKAASAILEGENGQPVRVCINSIKGRDTNEMITLVELNQISDSIITETSLYNIIPFHT